MQVLSALFLVALTLTSALAQSCRPGDTCKEPDCRCWNDPSLPGGFTAQDVPQIVLVSFEYAINSGNVDLYTGIFNGIKNPNGCDPKGTFFVQKANTDFGKVKELYDAKHEIGMTSTDGTIPQDRDQWENNFQEMKAELLLAGVPEPSIQGTRGPELYVGGNDMFDAIDTVGLGYDSTCTTIEYTTKENLLWPYTYDFTEGTPQCTIGRTPTQSYPGKWQFLVADLEFNGQKCASPSACSPLLKTAQDAFDLLYESYAKHYDGKKSPFLVYMNPSWLMTDYQVEGTKLFFEFIRASYPDTWLLTTQQALAYIKDPVASANATTFQPWLC